MEFQNKLQLLRKQKELTQEKLAGLLFVSRTAISKWESGKGYPNIESLKSIACIFDVTIDELLSSDELIDLAVTANRTSLSKAFGSIYAIIDIMAITFIFLPLYGQPSGAFIQAVNLVQYSHTSRGILMTYWIIFIMMIILGLAQLIFIYFEKEKWRSVISQASFILDSSAIVLFFASREPYAGALLFLFFVIKSFTLLKEITMNRK